MNWWQWLIVGTVLWFALIATMVLAFTLYPSKRIEKGDKR